MPHAASASVVIAAPRAAVWAALTEPPIIKQYFFGTEVDTDWKVGSPLFFRGAWEGKRYEDRGTVLAFEPMRRLSFNYWSAFSGLPDTPAARQIVGYTLDDADGGVRVTIEQSNVDTEARAEHSAENWRGVLAALKKLLER
ncbi:MAG TPA: SRPBCC domain-containing protein [Polyangia bacterium]|nr:SRPBCC domain-containing protein [Polyangia bacterium]